MSSVLRDPVSASMMLGGVVIAIVGLAVTFGAGQALAWLLVALGLVLELGGAWVHDWMHRRRGERPHAFWGQDDRNRPRLIGGPRKS